MINYIIWGGTTTFINIICYATCCLFLNYRMANFVTIIVSKIYAYIVNKLFVFKSKNKDGRETLHELFRYILSRGATGVLDFCGVIILVEFIGINKLISKGMVAFVVLILNYLFGKYLVF